MKRYNFYTKFRKRYGLWFIISRFFELKNVYDTLEKISEISSNTSEFYAWSDNTRVFTGSYQRLREVVQDFNNKKARAFHRDLDIILKK